MPALVAPNFFGFALNSTTPVPVLPLNPSRGALLFHNPNVATGVNIWIAPGANSANAGFTVAPNGAGSFWIAPGGDRLFLPPQFMIVPWFACVDVGKAGNISIMEFGWSGP